MKILGYRLDMKEIKVWLLLAADPAQVVFDTPHRLEKLDVSSRSADLTKLISRIAKNRSKVDTTEEEWRSAKKALTNVLGNLDDFEAIKKALELPIKSLPWQMLFKYSAGQVGFQPWVEVDYWLICELNDRRFGLEEAKPVNIAVTALNSMIKSTLARHTSPELKEASNLWSNTKEIAFRDLEPESGEVLGRLLKYLEKVDQTVERKSNKELETGEFPSWFVWSRSVMNDIRFRRERIVEAILDGNAIPQVQLYCSYESTVAWLSISDVTVNEHEAASVARIAEASKEIAQAIDVEGTVNFLSLGPGDGVKDSKLLEALSQNEKIDVNYCPTDISPLMLGIAVSQVRHKIPQIPVTGIISDLNTKTLRATNVALPKAEDSTTVISFLGNTLGNLDHDWLYIKNINQTLKVGDYFLLEVRTAEALERTIKVEVNDPLQMSFTLVALEAIKANFDLSDICHVTEEDEHGTVVVINCANVSHEKFGPRVIDLDRIKHYNSDYFDKVAKEIGAEILYRIGETDSNTQIALFKKNSPSA